MGRAGVVDVQVAKRGAVFEVDGDVVAVVQDGDGLGGACAVDADLGRTDREPALLVEAVDADAGVLLDGQLDGPAELGGAVPGAQRGLVGGAVAALLVVPALVAVAQLLQLGERRG